MRLPIIEHDSKGARQKVLARAAMKKVVDAVK
jgi:hypothetical protein